MEITDSIIRIPIFKCMVHLFIGNKNNIKIALQKEFGASKGDEFYNKNFNDNNSIGSSVQLPNDYIII